MDQTLTVRQHGTCPACRGTFADIEPAPEEDNESSDGDYVPGDDDEEDEEDGFDADADAFTEGDDEFGADWMDLDVLDAFGGDIAADVDHWLAHSDLHADPVLNGFASPPFHRRDGSVENWGLSDGGGSDSLSEIELALAEPAEDDNTADQRKSTPSSSTFYMLNFL